MLKSIYTIKLTLSLAGITEIDNSFSKCAMHDCSYSFINSVLGHE